jgi:hypothetical protein
MKILSILQSNMRWNFLSVEEMEFIEENEKHWRDIKTEPDKGKILIESFLMTPSYIFQAGRIAKSIQEETGCEPVIFTRRIFRQSNYFLFRSFQIDKIIYRTGYFLNPVIVAQALWHAISFYARGNTGRRLLDLRFKDVDIGDLIYDSIIRHEVAVYTLPTVAVRFWKQITMAYFNVLVIERVLQKNAVKYVVLSHKDYTEFGTIARVCHRDSIPVILSFKKRMKKVKKSNVKAHRFAPTLQVLNETKNNQDKMKSTQEYLDVRFRGASDSFDSRNAFADKPVYTREMLFRKISVPDDGKPLVFIMLHEFSDAPHCSESMLYMDYYDWFTKTIDYVSKLDNAHWIAKVHPVQYTTAEGVIADSLIQRHKGTNVHLCPGDMNTISIKDLAHAVVTAQGTAGVEFSSFGIPVVITGKAFYSGFGFSLEPATIAEYEGILSSIESLEALDEDQMKTAKAVIGATDLFSDLDDKIYPDVNITPRNSYQDFYKIELKSLTANMKNNSPRDGYYHAAKGFVELTSFSQASN